MRCYICDTDGRLINPKTKKKENIRDDVPIFDRTNFGLADIDSHPQEVFIYVDEDGDYICGKCLEGSIVTYDEERSEWESADPGELLGVQEVLDIPRRTSKGKV